MFLGGSLYLVVAVLMYWAWRLWLRLQGKGWKPAGRPPPARTDAMHQYLQTLPPLTRGDRVRIVVTMTATLIGLGALVALILRQG